MSGLAATRLVKQRPGQALTGGSSGGGGGGDDTGQSLFNATHFLDRKTDHAAYLHKTLFSTVAIAMSQMATVRPPAPFLWLGIYLLRHSGMCRSVELQDGRVVVCDGSAAQSTPAASTHPTRDDDESTQDGRAEEEEGEESWDGKLSDSDGGDEDTAEKTRTHGSSSSGSGVDDDGEEEEGKATAAVRLQSNFRRHKAQKEFYSRRQEQQQQRAEEEERQRVSAASEFRTFRHGVRIGRAFYHAMASTNGELRVTDSRTMATVLGSCPPGTDAAGNLAVVSQCVREAVAMASPDVRRLMTQPVCVRPLVVSGGGGGGEGTGSGSAGGPGTGSPGARAGVEDFHGLAFLHFEGPTALLYDQATGRVFVSSGGGGSGGGSHQGVGGGRGRGGDGGGPLADRKAFARDPDAALAAVWRDKFAGVARRMDEEAAGGGGGDPTVFPSGALGVSAGTAPAAVVACVNAAAEGTAATVAEVVDSHDRGERGWGELRAGWEEEKTGGGGTTVCYVIDPGRGAGRGGGRPPAVRTNNFTAGGGGAGTPVTVASPMRVRVAAAAGSPKVLLPRVIRTAHRFREAGCRVMVEINHRSDPVRVVVFEQRTMTSEEFYVARAAFVDLPVQGADDRAWIDAVLSRLRCSGQAPSWVFSMAP